MKQKTNSFRKINNIDKLVARLIRKKSEGIITSIKNDGGDTTIDAKDIKELFFNNKNNLSTIIKEAKTKRRRNPKYTK